MPKQSSAGAETTEVGVGDAVEAASMRSLLMLAAPDGDSSVLRALVEADKELNLVAVVSSATAAVSVAQQHHPDVALLDVSLGDDAVQATREIRRHSPLTSMVAVCASEDAESVSAVMGAGAVARIAVTWPQHEILAAILQAAGAPSIGALAGRARALPSTPAEAGDRHSQRGERFRRALRGDGYHVAFQPVCELASRRVIGVEALSRFDALPVQGPAEWFAEAEEHGLRVQLELMAMRAALQEADRHAPGLFIAINVSPATLMSEEFGVALPDSSHHIVIELTERAITECGDGLGEALRPLRNRGGQIAVDDVGAGFATLQHMLHLGPDYIKLDMAITRRIAHDRGMRALAFGITAFALELGAVVIAEGIESDAELRALRGVGVSYGQGFHLGWPGDWPVE